MIGMLLTAQSEWRKPRGVNAKLGFPPKSDHKILFASILETLGADSQLHEALIEIKHLPATTRGGDAWQIDRAHLVFVASAPGAPATGLSTQRAGRSHPRVVGSDPGIGHGRDAHGTGAKTGLPD